MTTRPAINEPPAAEKTGSRPYEMEGRREDRVPLFGFEDLSGWTVELHDGAEAELVRSREQQLWGDYVGKLTYKGALSSSRLVLRPAKPVPIPGEFDCVNFWIYGNNWGWQPDPKTPQVPVNVLILDSEGEEHSYELTRVRWREWWLAHKKIGKPMKGASFAGIVVGELANTENNVIYLDSIYFYEEDLKPLKFDPRPARNLTPFPGQDQGLNTGPGRLPFPTREQTILPTNFAKGFKNSAREVSPGAFEFVYDGPDCKVKYVYSPKTGSLGEVEAFVNDRRVAVPMYGGGIQFADGTKRDGKLIQARLKDGVLRTTWEFGKVKAEFAFRIWQKSLVMDFICPPQAGEVSGLSFGEVREVESPSLVLIPFLTLGANPKVLCSGKNRVTLNSIQGPQQVLNQVQHDVGAVFASIWADWYRSNGSELWSEDWAQETSAKINGGVRYLTRTDGKRNDVYDRVFLTVSPTFEETLPTVANPPSPLGKIAGERLWQESWGPENYAKEHERSKMLRSYGIDKLTQCNHEITWRDGGESFTLRTKAAPGRGGDEALKNYVAQQQSLGWLSGLYTNYTDFAPVNENWDEDIVQRTPDGEWRPAWPRCYALKPSRAVELDAKLAPIIKRKFGSNAAYTDVQTAVSPWAYCDYDARVPGAGTFAATFYAYGELLLHDQKTYGPTWSEGTYHWLYAGLATGNYGLAYSQPDMSKEPLNVAFDLMKIHPLECDIGMPWTGGFFKSGEWQGADKIEQSIDHFIAATIAYGHIGWLVEEVHGIQRTCRSYYMLQQLQKRYAMKQPAKIEYADENGKWLTVSQAIATDAIKLSRLHVVYENGLDIYINGSNEFWTLPSGVILPSWGWYASDTTPGVSGTEFPKHPVGEFVELSALVDGHRVDYVRSPDYEYLDGRGLPTTHNGLAAKGSIAVRRKGKSVEVIDIYGNDEIGVTAPGARVCTAYDPDGKSLGEVELRQAQSDMVWFKAKEGARRYVIRPSRATSNAVEMSISFASDRAAPGDTLEAEVCCAANRDSRLESACITVDDAAGVAVPEWNGVDLKAGEMRCARVPVTFPNGLARGSRAWVRLDADVRGKPASSWAALSVVPAFEIGMREVEPDWFALDVISNLAGSKEPEIKLDIQPSDSGFGIRKRELNGETVYSITPPGRPGVEAALVVSAQSGEFVSERRFAVSSVEEHPLVKSIAGREGLAWGYAYRGKSEQSGGAEGAAAQTGAVSRIDDLTCGGVFKRAIFMHPPWINGVGYTYCLTGPILLPDKDCEFRGFIGLSDGGAESDGVVFTVSVIDETGASQEILNRNWKERKWKEVSADLSRFRGKTIRLRFVADVGPNDNPTADWASWGEPRVVEKAAVIRVAVEH